MQLTCAQTHQLPARSFRSFKSAHSPSCSARRIRSQAVRAAARTTEGRTRANEQKSETPEQQTPAAAVAGPVVANYLPLVLVSLLWGSYTPALRYLYSMDGLLTPQALTANRTVISAVALLSASAVSITYSTYKQHQQRQQRMQAEQDLQQQQHELRQQRHIVADKLQHWLPHWMSSRHRSASSPTSSSSSSSEAGHSAGTAAAVLAAGMELGIWNFFGTASQAIGLELSTATKAAFLTQTTAVFTPCLAVLCGQAVAPTHWVACIVALLGSCCITLDSLIDVSAYVAPAAAAAAVEAAAPAAAATLAAEQPPTSSSSGLQYSIVAAPDLQATDQQTAGLAVASSTSLDAVMPPVGISSSSMAVQGLSSSNCSSSSGAAELAVSCSAASAPPQRVVPPNTHAQVAGYDGQGVLVAGAGAAPLVSSDSSSIGGLQSQPQQLAAESVSPMLLPASSSSSSVGQPTDPSVNGAAKSSTTAAGEDADSINSSSSFSGELYILLACCCYAIATVRLSMLAPGLNPVHLATSKTLALAAASLCWLLAFPDGNVTTSAAAAAAVNEVSEVAGNGSLRAAITAAVESAAEAAQLPETFRHGKGLLILVYSALGPGALAAVMQAQGQSTVSAAQAQVFYSLTPVWAALMALLLLQGEEMGPLAWVGGGVIVAASIGAAICNGSGGSGGRVNDPGSKVVSSEQWEGK